MIKGDFPTHQPLSHMQKDLRLALGMSEILDHSLPITATINEIFKQAKRAGYSEHDSSAIYLKSKFWKRTICVGLFVRSIQPNSFDLELQHKTDRHFFLAD